MLSAVRYVVGCQQVCCPSSARLLQKLSTKSTLCCSSGQPVSMQLVPALQRVTNSTDPSHLKES
jgi:hypothetical protein